MAKRAPRGDVRLDAYSVGETVDAVCIGWGRRKVWVPRHLVRKGRERGTVTIPLTFAREKGLA